MPSFLDLPRELRQTILQLALKDAVDHDTRLNELLRDGIIFHCQTYPQLWISIKEYLNVYFKDVPLEKSYAPFVSGLAATLLATSPYMAEDIAFVLHSELKDFARVQKTIDEEKPVMNACGLMNVTLGLPFAFEYLGTSLDSVSNVFELGQERITVYL